MVEATRPEYDLSVQSVKILTTIMAASDHIRRRLAVTTVVRRREAGAARGRVRGPHASDSPVCRALCRNPAIPVGVGLSQRVSL
jgi:hypothetical protein